MTLCSWSSSFPSPGLSCLTGSEGVGLQQILKQGVSRSRRRTSDTSTRPHPVSKTRSVHFVDVPWVILSGGVLSPSPSPLPRRILGSPITSPPCLATAGAQEAGWIPVHYWSALQSCGEAGLAGQAEMKTKHILNYETHTKPRRPGSSIQIQRTQCRRHGNPVCEHWPRTQPYVGLLVSDRQASWVLTRGRGAGAGGEGPAAHGKGRFDAQRSTRVEGHRERGTQTWQGTQVPTGERILQG